MSQQKPFGGSGSDEEVTTNSSVSQNSVSQNSVLINNNSLVLNDSSAIVDDSNLSGTTLESSTTTEESSTVEESETTESGDAVEWVVTEGEYLSGIVADYYGTYDIDFVAAVAEYNNMSIETGLEIDMIILLPPESELNIQSAE